MHDKTIRASMVKPFYADEAVSLYHGECLDILPQLGPVDHVITDPPYEAEAHTEGRRIKTIGGGGNYGETGGCVLDFAPISPRVRRESARLTAALVRRWALVFCQVEAVASWRNALVRGGLNYRRTCAYLKRDAQPQLS